MASSAVEQYHPRGTSESYHMRISRTSSGPEPAHISRPEPAVISRPTQAGRGAYRQRLSQDSNDEHQQEQRHQHQQEASPSTTSRPPPRRRHSNLDTSNICSRGSDHSCREPSQRVLQRRPGSLLRDSQQPPPRPNNSHRRPYHQQLLQQQERTRALSDHSNGSAISSCSGHVMEWSREHRVAGRNRQSRTASPPSPPRTAASSTPTTYVETTSSCSGHVMEWSREHRVSGRNRQSRTASPPSPPRTAASSTPTTYVEIEPGVKAPLRKTQETVSAISRNFIVSATCFGCDASLYCIADAKFLICPQCRVVSPLFLQLPDNNGEEGHGVGLGFTRETLLATQADTVVPT